MEAHATALVVPDMSSGSMRSIVAAFLLRYPPKTRTIYACHIGQWVEWCLSNGLDPLRAQRAHFELWARYLTEVRGLKVSTVASKLNAVCGCYKFAHLDGLMATNPAAYVRRPSVAFVSSAQALSRAETADVLRFAEAEGPTTYALIVLLAFNGLRIGECLDIDIEHFSYERGYRTLFLPHRKGGKVGTLSLAVRTAYAVDMAIAGRSSGPLLLGKDGSRLKVAAARRTVRRLVRKAGVTKRITPHSFRHGFITMAQDAGVPERDILASTGHSTPAMLMYYDRNRGSIERNATHAVAAFVGVA